MDIGHWYASRHRHQVCIYLPEGSTAPLTFEVEHVDLGEPVPFYLLRAESLDCRETFVDDVKGRPVSAGRCKTYDCHRRELGKCQCGRHDEPVRFEKATG
jgi:hypothetical protein